MQFDNLRSEKDIQVRRDILAMAAGIGLVIAYAVIIRLVVYLLAPVHPMWGLVIFILIGLFFLKAPVAYRTYAMIAVSLPFLVVIKVAYKISKRELLKARLAILNFIVGFIGGIAGALLFFTDFAHLLPNSILGTLLAAVGIGIFLGFILSYAPFDIYKKD